MPFVPSVHGISILNSCMTDLVYSTNNIPYRFVCLAEDPAVLARQQPALFARFQAVYPQVVWGMRSDSTFPLGTLREDGCVSVSLDV